MATSETTGRCVWAAAWRNDDRWRSDRAGNALVGRWLALAAFGMVVLLVIVFGPQGPDRTAEALPSVGRLMATPTGSGPTLLAAGAGEPIPAGEDPLAVAAGEGALWVADCFAGTLTRIDAASGTVGDPIDLGVATAAGDRPYRLNFACGTGAAVADGVLWVATKGDGT